MATGPLAGIRVLDVSHTLAGPLTGMHLGDLGAEVVKLERPTGDEWRFHEVVAGHPGRSRHHLQTNRNKRSLCVDLTHDDGRAIAHALVARADVLVTNLRPGVPERLGIDWATCESLNPRLVYCQLSAYGDGGPRREDRGYDLVAAAVSGLIPDDGGPDHVPRPAPAPLTDTGLPLLACTGILAALLERERSGRGQRVELSLLGMAVALNVHALVRLDEQPPPTPAFPRAFYAVYRCSDGWIAVAAYAERLARRLCDQLGMPGLLDLPRYRTRADRARFDDEIAERFRERFATRPRREWLAALGEAGIPSGPVRDRDALFDDPQVATTGLLAGVDDPDLGAITMAAPAVRLSRTPGAIRFPGRHLGQDTREVLRELGYRIEDIERLERAGTIISRDP